jgi:hypothetical protein
MIYMDEAHGAMLDYEAYTGGWSENMSKDQGMRFEQIVQEDPDMPFFIEVRRRRVERESDMRFHISWCLHEKLDELMPVSRVDVEREERALDSRVRKLDFEDYKRQRDAELEILRTDRKAYVAERMQGLGILLPVIPAEERADMIKIFAFEWQSKLAVVCGAEEIQQ